MIRQSDRIDETGSHLGSDPQLRPFCLARGSTRSPWLRAAPLPFRRTTSHPMAVRARIPFHGSTRMVTTTSPPCRTSSFPASITSKESWRVAADSMVWVQTTRAIASRGALPLRTIAIWPASIGLGDSHTKLSLPTPDLRYSRDRRSPQIRSTTFIRPFHRKDCTG